MSTIILNIHQYKFLTFIFFSTYASVAMVIYKKTRFGWLKITGVKFSSECLKCVSFIF